MGWLQGVERGRKKKGWVPQRKEATTLKGNRGCAVEKQRGDGCEEPKRLYSLVNEWRCVPLRRKSVDGKNGAGKQRKKLKKTRVERIQGKGKKGGWSPRDPIYSMPQAIALVARPKEKKKKR